MLEDALNFFVQLIFPPVCGLCGELHENWICEKCYKRIGRLAYDNKNFILSSKENKIYYDEIIYFFHYKSIVRNLMLRYKFNNQAYISNLFATCILKQEKSCKKIEEYDIIIPVPMFKKKKQIRGYNQTELIIEKVVKKLNIELDQESLIKIRNTKVQSTLTAEERKRNIQDAFEIKDVEKIRNKKIIVFDDIFTTGETVNEISKILKIAGAKEILVLILAKD